MSLVPFCAFASFLCSSCVCVYLCFLVVFSPASVPGSSRACAAFVAGWLSSGFVVFLRVRLPCLFRRFWFVLCWLEFALLQSLQGVGDS